MRAYFRRCESDQDYAQFTLYFIRHRADFNPEFSLQDTLTHVLESLHDSHIVLVEDDLGTVVGWIHYRYVTADHQTTPEGEIVFVNSVIVAEKYRSSRTFIRGFRHLVKQIAEENKSVKQFQFYAQSNNVYLNRLYAKFADVIGEREGYFGTENIYSTNFDQLYQYLMR